MTIDPHGRYLAVGTRQTTLHFVNRYGRPAGSLETMQSLSHLCFVPGRPMAVGAAAFGTMVGIALEPGRSQGRLDTEILWQERLLSNVGRLAVDGDGGMILASCYTLGIQRFDLRGRNEGSYHLGGTVSHAVPDFPGRTIATATLEGELAVINSAGNVRWRTTLPRPVVALEVDPLGRYVIYGHSTGEIVRLDLFGGKQDRPAASVDAAAGCGLRRKRQAARPAPCATPTGWFPWSRPTSRPRPPSSPSSTIRPRSPCSQARIAFSSSTPRARSWGRALIWPASAGSYAPPPAGSPPRQTVRSSSAT